MKSKRLSLGNKMLIKKGLQLQAWVTTNTDKKVLEEQDWNDSFFTTITYYEKPMYNQQFHNRCKEVQWALAKAPYGDKIKDLPKDHNKFLTIDQENNIDNLITICFGDEENYSEELINNLKQWFELSHRLYPEALVHTNQWIKQWTLEQYMNYIKTAKPDLITYDSYYFCEEGEDLGYCKQLYEGLCHVREAAQRGYDGNYECPLPFGQYTLGYKTGKSPELVGEYIATESQINLVTNATWTFGGKWISLFRWAKGDKFLLIDELGKRTLQFNQYSELNKQSRNLGPHLVRLNSTDIRVLPGDHVCTNNKIKVNQMPELLKTWDSEIDEYIKQIKVVNLGKENNGLKGDIIIGYFEMLPDIDKSFFSSPNAKYFMVLNGLISGNGTKSIEQHGSSEETQQKISMFIDFNKNKQKQLKKVNKNTGEIQTQPLHKLEDNKYFCEFKLGGGMAELFFWE